MCVIIACPTRKRPSLEILKACERANPHGSGLAWVQKKMVYYIKGLSASAIDENLSCLKGPVVIHFRIATVGGPKPELCHPFPVSKAAAGKTYGHARSVLFHNGHWSDWLQFVEEHGVELDGPISDTRVAAVASAMFGFSWLTNIPNRFALLSARKGIRFIGDWREHKGVYYSNDVWQRNVPLEQSDLFFGAM